jgi:hypothetical protein
MVRWMSQCTSSLKTLKTCHSLAPVVLPNVRVVLRGCDAPSLLHISAAAAAAAAATEHHTCTCGEVGTYASIRSGKRATRLQAGKRVHIYASWTQHIVPNNTGNKAGADGHSGTDVQVQRAMFATCLQLAPT